MAAPMLLRWMVFNVVVGNADGHAKNLSLLQRTPGSWTLAPFYDLVCTAAWEGLHRQLVVSVGGAAALGDIGRPQWEQLALDLGVGKRLVLEVVHALLAALPARLDAAMDDVATTIGAAVPRGQQLRAAIAGQARRAERLLGGRSAR